MDVNQYDSLYLKLKNALKAEIEHHHLGNEKVSIRCSVLTAEDAIGNPEDRDYPIIKGREKMLEASFKGVCGQVFTDEFGNADYTIDEILAMPLDSNRRRAEFLASLNAIFRYLKLCDKTVHCKDHEPRECANDLLAAIDPSKKVLLVGYQPRFLEYLSRQNSVRVVDLDIDNVGTEKFGITIEPCENTDDAIEWCDLILATGSTIVNCSIADFWDRGKPVIFYGVTISAAAKILNLKTYCSKGR